MSPKQKRLLTRIIVALVIFFAIIIAVSYTHLTLPTICSV